jgi:hypothetical protein
LRGSGAALRIPESPDERDGDTPTSMGTLLHVAQLAAFCGCVAFGLTVKNADVHCAIQAAKPMRADALRPKAPLRP